ncbi:DUF4234 domain-containing protein [Catenovulum agarivorans]|uniref:DUF4234 domain-containing protein n=1 Tax=Catenovulum agarivorans TaxID=1172192 RepID=UPI00031C28D2|nr:DUF4234 domain-containing protein [Catenovulum agarivorans]
MTTAVDNAFEAPKAELADLNTNDQILNLKRFSAWGVFFLSLITLGIYFIYWLYTRSTALNKLETENKVNMTNLYVYIATYIVSQVVSIAAEFMPEQLEVEIVSLVIGLINFGFYIAVAFSIRKVLGEVLNKNQGDQVVGLSGGMTFFFSAIYFQFKINKAHDEIKEASAE